MTRSTATLREDALRIWRAGLDAVRSERLMADAIHVEAGRLIVGEQEIPLDEIDRIEVVGAGKAGAGMAAGLEEALGPELLRDKRVSGWINVPADCLRPTRCIHLHAARAAGRNEPTAEGAAGASEILRRVKALGPRDLCLVLISGGGSALAPLPIAGISLADKLAVTRHLSAAGAPIEHLNTVRKQLSAIKGGRLAAACRAGRMISLIISDVLGDPLDVIASGMTVPDTSTPRDALALLEKYRAREAGISPAVFAALNRAQDESQPAGNCQVANCQVANIIIGNNALAVDAAGMEAERLGYSHAMVAAKQSEGAAEEVGRHLADMALHMRFHDGPNCLISGGEPVVTLAPVERRGRGGRNQQLVLAAAEQLQPGGAEGIVILSGGTDGEDGPTDAAGAVLDATLLAEARRRGLDPHDYLTRNDAYHWFQPLGGLIITGPTHTNVCDVRVVVVDRTE